MSRPLRVAAPGGVFHVIARGNARQAIFLDSVDRARFLELGAHVVERYGLLCHGYCLMDNHYHLLLETPRANLSSAMRQLNGLYAAHFNRAHDRCGHVFQGRFRSIQVEKETHLLEVSRYIVLNPVRARLCNHPAEHVWSSFRPTAGLCARPRFLTTDWILGAFGSERASASERYRAYVAEGFSISPRVVGERVGSASFLRRRHGGETRLAEVPRAQLEPMPPPLEHVFASSATPVATAYRRHAYTLTEIADYLGCHYSTASRRLRREEAVLECKT